MDTHTCRWCGQSLRPAGKSWVHDGWADNVYCLAGLIRTWLVPVGDPDPQEGWGSQAIITELATADHDLMLALESLGTAGDAIDATRAALHRTGAGDLAAAFADLRHTIDTYRGEAVEVADQLTLLSATATTATAQPTPIAATITLTGLLDDLGVTTLAILHTTLISPEPPSLPTPLSTNPPHHLLTHLTQAHNHFTHTRAHLDRAREAIAATLTTLAHTG